MSGEQRAKLFYDQGVVFRRNGNYAEAVASFQTSAELFRSALQWANQGEARHALAEVLHLIGRHREASHEFAEAYDIWMLLGRTWDAASEILDAGAECIDSEEYDWALDYCTKAANMYRQLGDQRGFAKCCTNIEICRSNL